MLNRLETKDEWFLIWLARRYAPLLRARRLGDEEDAYQIAWIAYLQAKKIAEEKNCAILQATKLQFLAILNGKYLNRSHYEKSYPYDEGVCLVAPVSRDPPVDQQAIIEENLSFCYPSERRVLEAYYLNEETYDEIVERFGITHNSAVCMCAQGKKRIRQHYKEEDYVKGTQCRRNRAVKGNRLGIAFAERDDVDRR